MLDESAFAAFQSRSVQESGWPNQTLSLAELAQKMPL